MKYIQPTKIQANACFLISAIGLILAALLYSREMPGAPRDLPAFPQARLAAVLAVCSFVPLVFAIRLKFGALERSIEVETEKLIQIDTGSPERSFSVRIDEIERLIVEVSYNANDTMRVETRAGSHEVMFIPGQIREQLIDKLRSLNRRIEVQRTGGGPG